VVNKLDKKSYQERVINSEAMLTRALALVNTAIAQQELMSSSVTLFAIDQHLLSWRWPDSPEWCVVGFSKNLPTSAAYDKYVSDSRNQIRDYFMQSNSSVFDLLRHNPALAENWGTYIGLYARYPGNISKYWRHTPRYKPDLDYAFNGHPMTDRQRIAYLVSLHYARTYQDIELSEAEIKNNVLLYHQGMCGQTTINEAFFGPQTVPHSFPESIAPSSSAGRDKVVVPLPSKVDPNDDAINSPRYLFEMYVLRDLKRQLLDAISQYEGFKQLSRRQRLVATHLILRATNE
jgi:hypothetical protein